MRVYQKYISLKSVIQDIQSMSSQQDWNEADMFEWAAKGYRKLNLPAKFEDMVIYLPVEEHTCELPQDLVFINQIFYKIDNVVHTSTFCPTEDDDTSEVVVCKLGVGRTTPPSFIERLLTFAWHHRHFRPLHRSTSTFDLEDSTQCNVPNRVNDHTYNIVNDTTIQTSFKEGYVFLSYKRYMSNDCDDMSIPDDEDLKDALFHFCMYRWWMMRAMMKEEGAGELMRFHQTQYNLLGKKAVAKITSPDLDTLENIKNNRNRLVPKENMYDTAFSRLQNQERDPISNYLVARRWAYRTW